MTTVKIAETHYFVCSLIKRLGKPLTFAEIQAEKPSHLPKSTNSFVSSALKQGWIASKASENPRRYSLTAKTRKLLETPDLIDVVPAKPRKPADKPLALTKRVTKAVPEPERQHFTGDNNIDSFLKSTADLAQHFLAQKDKTILLLEQLADLYGYALIKKED